MDRMIWELLERPRLEEKEAGVKLALGKAISFLAKNPAFIPLAVGGASAVAGGIKGILDDDRLKDGQRQAFATALQLYPDIKNEDPTKVRQLWATVIQFAPHVATNPHVLGTFLNSALKYTSLHVGPQEIRGLQELEESLTGTGRGQRQDRGGFGSMLGSALSGIARSQGR